MRMIKSLDKSIEFVEEKINQTERDKESKIASLRKHFEEQMKSF
jgi:hypothetical protein